MKSYGNQIVLKMEIAFVEHYRTKFHLFLIGLVVAVVIWPFWGFWTFGFG